MANNFNLQNSLQQTQPTPQFPSTMQQYFLQPQGNIYMLNSSNETGIIPIGQGLSAGICLAEGTMYLKTLQNGAPVMLSYRLSPLENSVEQTGSSVEITEKVKDYLGQYEKRLSQIEELLKRQDKGGKLEWPVL